MNSLVVEIVKADPEYDFTADDGVKHTLWVVNDESTIANISKIFSEQVPFTYIADGHHRAASSAKIGKEIEESNPNHTGDEEYNFFLTVLFPSSQMNIIDYNRAVKDLNGNSTEEFMSKLADVMDIEKVGSEICKPASLHEFSMYMDKTWYKLTAKAGTYTEDPMGILDVSILQNNVLNPILGIDDPRTNTRIDFIGGIRGLGELEKRVDSGDMKVAFALYPVTIQQLIDIADSGNVMPPKSTWFEPKLRSGMVVHKIKE